jgi:hypothetical protein
LRNCLGPFLLAGLIGLSGCAKPVSLGRLIHDPAHQAALTLRTHGVEVSKGVFRTVIYWGPRQMAFIEVVKKHAQGGLSIAAITDLGTTLYAVQIDPNGVSRVIRKSLPFSDQWLLDGLVAELLILWQRPPQPSHLRQLDPDHRALVHQEGRRTVMYVFDRADQWIEYQRLWRQRSHCRISLEWDNDPLPKVMRVHNPKKHYRVVRERVRSTGQPSEPAAGI